MALQNAPESNMAILANGAELTRTVVASMMGNENVRDLFGRPQTRENVYRMFMMSVHKKIEGQIRNLPTGQFNATVLTGAHQSGAVDPNVKTQ